MTDFQKGMKVSDAARNTFEVLEVMGDLLKVKNLADHRVLMAPANHLTVVAEPETTE